MSAELWVWFPGMSFTVQYGLSHFPDYLGFLPGVCDLQPHSHLLPKPGDFVSQSGFRLQQVMLGNTVPRGTDLVNP